MARKVITSLVMVIFAGVFLVSLYGCVAVVAGAAGGAGTATWLSHKLTQQVNATPQRCQEAARVALQSMNYKIVKEISKTDVIQIKGEYSDGRTIWIDIRPTTSSASRIDVRVGAVSDKEAARQILDRIMRYL